MRLQSLLEAPGRRRAVRAAGLLAVVAALAMCAHAGGQPHAARSSKSAQGGGVALTAIRATADTGRAAQRGPSANIGQTIRFVGTGFDSNVSVQFTSFANSTFLVLPTQVRNRRVTVPVPAASATGASLLSDPESGQSNSLVLQIVPTITGLSATSIAPGAQLFIDGTGFTTGARVTFQGVAEPVVPTIVSPTRIDIVVPASARTGRIRVVTEGGTSKPKRLTVTASAR